MSAPVPTASSPQGTTPSGKRAILFLGATGGCGVAALRRSLLTGHSCVALCRTPSKLTEKLSIQTPPANLTVVKGDATDIDAMRKALVNPSDPTSLVDDVVFTIGGAMQLFARTLDDPDVCRRAMETLLSALAASTASSSPEKPRPSSPRILVISTTGISSTRRDVPLAFLPFYKYVLHVPHEDKLRMEKLLFASKEATSWTVIRPSLLMDGPSHPEKPIRVGVESPEGEKLVSKDGVGYIINREDVGRWIFETLIEKPNDATWVKKIATITW